MPGLEDLYREIILDHYRTPRNRGELESPPAIRTDGHNPLCGDKLKLYLDLDSDDIIRDVAFEGSGCAISVASSSLMTEHAKGASIGEIDALFERVHDMLTGDDMGDLESLDKLAVLSGVREYPTRVKCASLAWHALKNAIAGSGKKVSTE